MRGKRRAIPNLPCERQNILVGPIDLPGSLRCRDRQLVALRLEIGPLRRLDNLTHDFAKSRIGGGKRDGPLDLDLEDRRLAGSVVVGVDDDIV